MVYWPSMPAGFPTVMKIWHAPVFGLPVLAIASRPT